MEGPQHAANIFGYTLTALGSIGSGLVWLVGQVPGSEIPQHVANNAGQTAFWIGLTGIVTLVTNAILAGWKDKVASEERIAMRRVDDRLDRLDRGGADREKRLETSATAIDAHSAALEKVAKAVGVEIDNPPMMDGGSGMMHPPPKKP